MTQTNKMTISSEEYRKRVRFTDDFFFARLMQNEDLCRRLAQVLLGVKIKSVTLHQTQRELKRERNTHGIRLDAYLEDENRVIVIEMQTASQKSLFRRIRLYQGMLDTAMLPAGKSYMSLKDTYIIFLCTFDPVGKGLPVYTVRQTYKETTEKDYDDGTCRILYNAPAWELCTDEQVRAVLEYMQTGLADSTLMQDIDTAIESERELQAMRDEYMTFDMRLCEVRDETAYEKALETARRALQRGLAPEVVSEITGLSIDDVESLGVTASTNDVRDRELQQIIEERVEQMLNQRVKENKMLWLAQGTRETRLETARNLIAMGLPLEQIAQAVGLSLEEVEGLL